jgi:hypothetical protein
MSGAELLVMGVCWAGAVALVVYHARLNRPEAVAPQAMCGRVVCAWCVPMRDLRPAPELPAGKITHGICPACFAAQMTEVAAAHQETNCGAGGSADLQRTGTPRAEAAGAAPLARGEGHVRTN